MSNDIHHAFAHPSERARATAGDRPLDRISLRDHVVEVEIGAFQSERGTTQRISFNVVVEVLPQAAGLDDDVDRILSYDKVTEAIAFELRAERLNLLETLAERVAERILREPQAQRVFVRIEKLDRGPGALGVEIVRARSAAPAPTRRAEGDVMHPHVVYLSNAAIDSPHLSAWLDQLQQRHEPVVLCVGAPAGTAPRGASAAVQRRIDLLAIEQNAWVLAGRDTRCVVVNTRTELDWAMRHDSISVWAPSKIVLDAPGDASAGTTDPLELAVWFATRMQAEDLLVIGDTLPDTGALAARTLPADAAAL